MKTTAFLLTMLVPAVVSAQQKPTTGYAPVNGLKMYYEVHGSGDPVVLLHGSFRTIGDMRPRSASRLAILPDTTHVTLMDRMPVIVPMVNDFLDAKPQKQ
jgi:pimeloyl-ACP methyl ester carboxylesterase